MRPPVTIMASKKQHDFTVVLRAWRGGEALEIVST